MANSATTNKKSSQGKILKKLPENPNCLVTWVTKSGKKYYVILDKEKQIHNVYREVDKGYIKIYSTKDYYTIEKELERFESNENEIK